MTGRPRASASKNDTGQPLGEAGQDQRPCGQQLLEDPLVAQVAGDPYPTPQAELVDELFDLAAHGAVAHDDQLEVVAPVPEAGRCLDQDRLALLLGDPADIDQPRG